jgi:hypothetical protein
MDKDIGKLKIGNLEIGLSKRKGMIFETCLIIFPSFVFFIGIFSIELWILWLRG